MALPIAIQLYSVRDFMEKDPAGTLRQIAAMGYDGIEPCGGSYDMDPHTFRALCDELGLKVISAHVSYNMLTTDLENQLSLYQTLGVEYIAYPYMVEGQRPGDADYETVLENMRQIGKQAQSRGIQMLYHNHDFEFEKIDGQYKLEYQFDHLTPEELQAELDTCWVTVSGEDPAAYIRKFTGRCPVVHLKDFYMSGEKPAHLYALIGLPETEADEGESKLEFRPTGKGMLNVPAVLEDVLPELTFDTVPEPVLPVAELTEAPLEPELPDVLPELELLPAALPEPEEPDVLPPELPEPLPRFEDGL